MVRKRIRTSEEIPVRARAEARLADSARPDKPSRSPEELLHELHVYQIELEMQNEALRESRLELEISRDRYLDLYEFAPLGFLSLSDTGKINEINLTGSTLLGKERHRLKGARFSLLVAPYERDRWHSTFMQTLEQGSQPSIELTMLRGDGSTFNAQIDSLHRQAEDEETTNIRFTLSDITERKQIHAREARMRRILDSTLDMILIFSADTMYFEYMNLGAMREIGYSRDEFLKMTPLNLLPQISVDEYRAFVRPLQSGEKETMRFETEILCKSGKLLSVEIRLQIVHDPNENGMFVAITRDITKRKLVEKKLSQQQNLIRQVIDTDPNIIYVKNAQGKFILANQALANQLGLATPDLLEKYFHQDEAIMPAFAVLSDTDRDVIANNKEVVVTESLLSNGAECWFHTVKRPLPQIDGTVNVLNISMDVTALKESERKLADSYKELQRLALHLENIRADERIQIGRNLHDEMGAILAALKMRIAWLASRIPDDLVPLKTESGHINELVGDGINTLRRVVAELRPNLLDDIGLAAAVRDYARKFERDSEITCQVTFSNDEYKLDEKQSITVFRIIQESLNNVAKHARASKVKIDFVYANGLLRVVVEDNGRGFKPGRMDKSYGLLGIKERARMIGGEASIESALSRGTRVCLNLPLSDLAQSEFDYS